MDTAYKTPWIQKKIVDDERTPVIPYTIKGKDFFKPYKYVIMNILSVD